jgi:sugar/nucleoside kinase (ribokinase family)
MVVCDIATVGHFSIDFIISPKDASTKPTLGGPPAYVSLAAAKLEAKAAAISKVGEDFPAEYCAFLRREGIDLSGVKKIKGASTTSFELKYSLDGQRRFVLRNRAPPIEIDDIPASFEAKAVHIAPIANEISYEVVSKLSGLVNLISLDPQGFLRHFRHNKSMYLSKMRTPKVLGQISILKASQKEIETMSGETDLAKAINWVSRKGVKAIIVTKGVNGAVLQAEKKTYHIPAAKPKRVVNTTGAGDVFMGGFLAEYIRGRDFVWSACVGSASASFVIEKLGLAGFGLKKPVYERATKVYEKLRVAT